METLIIHTSSKEYPVIIGEGAICDLKLFLQEQNFTKVLIVTDKILENIHLSSLMQRLEGIAMSVFVVPNGEEAKTFKIFYDAHTFALESHLDRNSAILAFGGGAVGDLAGFIAATYMRGVSFIQVPTTILAHDSAVGGKVAINHELGKNMIGAFYQPEAVFYDLNFLETLPKKELLSGFAEIIKHALISDEKFYQDLLTDVKSLEALPQKQLEKALTMGIKVKASIVEKDEKESNIRAFLNFGHTLGHAIEAELGYGRISHGEAVAIGMIYALKISKEMLGLTFNLNYFIQWLEALGYETSIPKQLSPENLLARMKSDKKSVNKKIRMVLLQKIGEPLLVNVDDHIILEMLSKMIEGG